MIDRDAIDDHDATLKVVADQPIICLMTFEQDRLKVRYVREDELTQDPVEASRRLEVALSAIGAWSDLDWDEFSTDLDRIRHGSQPSAPIDL